MDTVTLVKSLCDIAGIPFSRRQVVKFQHGYGMAYRAHELHLLHLRTRSQETASDYVNSCKEFRNIRKTESRNVQRAALQELRQQKRERNNAANAFEYAKHSLPKYHQHVTK